MAAADIVGQRLGQYQIIEQLGRGGMAVVYKAYQPALERYVAVKVLPRELTFDGQFVERFLREARAAARLNHPNIVTIHDVGQAEGVHFLVMEFVDGPSLTDLLRQQGAQPPEEVSRIISQVATALDYAHQHSFVHRDIKPGNILLAPDGTAKLTDFGIVQAAEGTRLTQTGTLLGTPAYMSPEQARGAEVGQGTDIYSMGVVAYEMLSGRVPFSGPTMAVLHAHVYEPPDLGVLPGQVRPAVGKALAKDPAARHASAGAFAQALRSAPGEAVTAVAEPPPPPPARPRRGPLVPVWAWVVGAVGLVVVLGSGITLALLMGPREETSTPTPSRLSATIASTITSVPVTVTSLPPDTPVSTQEPETVPATLAATPTPLSTATADLEMRWHTIGRSVQGRELTVASIGPPAKRAVVVVGSIQGDQPLTRELVVAVADHLERVADQLPKDVAFHLLPSLNPDGNAAESRFNANGVDLNRNWDTADWRSRAAVPGHPDGKAGAGGPQPFSEPETRAALDLISSLRRQDARLIVMVLHSSVRRETGEVYPGGENSIEMAYTYASEAGYDVHDQWAEYTTSGEMVTWCSEQGIRAIDVVVPGAQSPASRVQGGTTTLKDVTVDALLSLAEPPGQ
jgi:serine/threonine protein kinase